MEKKRPNVFHAVENGASYLFLALLVLIPFLEIILRTFFRTGILVSSGYTFHLVLLIAFVGGMITSRERQHLSIAVILEQVQGRTDKIIRTANALVASAISTALFWSSLSFVVLSFDMKMKLGAIPIQIIVLVIPLGFLVMAVRFVIAAPAAAVSKWIASLGFVIGSLLAFASIANMLFAYVYDIPRFIDVLLDAWYGISSAAALPLILLLIVMAFAGLPLFIVLGGIAFLLFAQSGGAMEVIPNEGYAMLTSSSMPAIPLFTLAGFLLSESKAGERLVRLFRALFGWLPGGLVIAAVMVSTFFTTFTGASGVTILALGALLSYVLIKSGNYSERFSTGLITASGSIGLLFPPSLAIIIYGSVAQINIYHLFLGGILPGLFMVVVMSLVGVIISLRRKETRPAFNLKEAFAEIKTSIWEILLPVLVIVTYFTGLTSLVETGALAVVYTLLIETVVHRELGLKDLRRVALKSLPIIGGVLIILAVARGLSYFIIDVQLPVRLTEWVHRYIDSRFVFLILINLALLITGCFMDIFSAIMVVAPLVIPLADSFGIHPVHMGIIFIANLELGFITPPVGINLFLSSYRFEKPLTKIYKYVLPFFLIQLVLVLFITYVPGLSLALVP
jgi:tripartite ATP-independent transporter DctM subunit